MTTTTTIIITTTTTTTTTTISSSRIIASFAPPSTLGEFNPRSLAWRLELWNDKETMRRVILVHEVYGKFPNQIRFTLI
ncbi:hypothetical protein M0804_009613 [Polistes exclamans]|nr:hypothetical protein M0804_009613 [Polistes exclamans]